MFEAQSIHCTCSCPIFSEWPQETGLTTIWFRPPSGVNDYSRQRKVRIAQFLLPYEACLFTNLLFSQGNINKNKQKKRDVNENKYNTVLALKNGWVLTHYHVADVSLFVAFCSDFFLAQLPLQSFLWRHRRSSQLQTQLKQLWN